MSNQLETLEVKDLAKILKCSIRTIQRRLKQLSEHPDIQNLLPPGREIGGKWIWLESVVFEWISPTPPLPSAFELGSLGQLAHQLIKKK